jgi:glycosyltransferase involved in cell wall biosynthesis
MFMSSTRKTVDRECTRSISIAMCTFNGSRYIVDQLESLSKQTRLPDELVVCDDASDDSTIEMVQEYVDKAPFPIRIHESSINLGPTKNFEKAIGLTTGDIVFLSDQDDVWHHEKIQRLEEIFERHPQVGGVFTDADVVDAQLHDLGYRMWPRVRFTDREQQLVLNGYAHRVLLKHYVVTGATMAFRAQFKPLIVPIPVSWLHDAWIALLLACTSQLTIIQQSLIRYRQHSANVIGARIKSLWDEISEARKVDRSQYYQEEIKRYEQLLARIRTYPGDVGSRNKLRQVERKLDHLCRRAGMPKHRIVRLPAVFGELVSLGYRHFARNWQSVLMDIFWRG